MLIRELFIQEKKQVEEYCDCSCDCGKAICESCGKKHKKNKIKEIATAGGTSAANVSVGAIYKNDTPRDKNGMPKAKQKKKKDGTAVNALDMGANIMTGGSIKR